MNAIEALKLAREALWNISVSIDTPTGSMAKSVYYATATIEQPEVASVAPMFDSHRLKPEAYKFLDLMRAWRVSDVGDGARAAWDAVVAHIDTHCAQQVAAALSRQAVDLFQAQCAATTQSLANDGLKAENDDLRAQLAAHEARASSVDADELFFNAQRLRNVLALTGVIDPFPDSDADTVAVMGVTLGQVAEKLRAQLAARSEPAAWLYDVEHGGETYPTVHLHSPLSADNVSNVRPLYTAPQPIAQPAKQSEAVSHSPDGCRGGTSEYNAGYRAALLSVVTDVRNLYVNHAHHVGVNGLLARCKETESLIFAEADAVIIDQQPATQDDSEGCRLAGGQCGCTRAQAQRCEIIDSRMPGATQAAPDRDAVLEEAACKCDSLKAGESGRAVARILAEAIRALKSKAPQPSATPSRDAAEAAQRAKLAERFANRAASPATADFDLPAESDAVSAAPTYKPLCKRCENNHGECRPRGADGCEGLKAKPADDGGAK